MSPTFPRIQRLPPYVFNEVNAVKVEARRRGEDIIDLGMGNPDQPPAPHIIEKLCEAARNPRNHRYSASRGIYKLRLAVASWYAHRYGVQLDPDSEVVVTIGSKEGISHLVLATIGPGDVVIIPNPTYPIHPFSVVIVGGEVRSVPLVPGRDFFEALATACTQTWPRPKMLFISFPHNPTTTVVDLRFFQKVVALAREHGIIVVHDLAYADLVFDGYRAPSLLEVSGAKDLGVEFFSLSKSYNMPGWRVGFCVGNAELVGALTRIKSYLDYGIFTPIQIASIAALDGPQETAQQVAELYRGRRDVLVEGLARVGWKVETPLATMFVWARIPDQFQSLGSLEFTKLLLTRARVAVSPGIGFGEYGEGYVRFALVENSHRIRQAIHGLKTVLQG